MFTLRVVYDDPADGAWNMATDEALWRLAETGVATLRFYGWSKPTLSLGYFQSLAERALLPEAAGCPVVRRASGGGALVHDRELTYSLALSAAQLAQCPVKDATALYAAVHQALITVLQARGLNATLAGCQTAKTDEPFLCFARRTPCDVVVQDCKVAGSAQRRSRGAILQHGGLILARSPQVPSLAGLAELGWTEAVSPAAIRILAEDWSQAIAMQLGAERIRSALAQTEQDLARQIAAEKFASREWTERR